MKLKRLTMKADVPTMAMGDIAFNLLIFFVILARAQDDSHLQWQPEAASDLKGISHSQVSVVIDNQNLAYNATNVPLTSFSIWDEFMQGRSIPTSFHLIRENYDAQAQLLLPLARINELAHRD